MASETTIRTRLAALETAYASGAKSVTVDGVTTTYRSADEMERAMRRLERQLPEYRYKRPLAFKVKMG